MLARQVWSALTALSLAVSSVPALAAPTPAKPKVVTINPATLRSYVVHNNYGVMESLNLIHQAKDQVDIARGRLLPSLNLGAIISGITAGPAFALTSISFLLPFLLPSNWANLHQNEDLLESQKIGFRLVELNNYAQAYALYETILSDIALREVLVTEYNDLVYVRDWLIGQQHFIGNITQSDIDNADAQVNLARVNLSALDETLIRERASLRQFLALDLNANIVLDNVHVAASPGEALDLAHLVGKVQAVAPENAQMVWMVKAAQEQRFSKEFGFLSGGNLNVGVTNGSPNFGNLSLGGGFNIGFDYVPTINLANDNIANLQLHGKELLSTEQQLVEATLGSVAQAKIQLDAASKAEAELIGVAQDEFQKYSLGHSDLLHVFDSEKAAAQATASKVKAQLDLDQLRVTMHRELLTDQFAGIPGSVIKAAAEEKDKNWLGRLFSPKDYSISIDEACAPAN